MKDKKIEEAMLSKSELPPVKFIRTGCDLLDILLGGSRDTFGIQAGTILSVWGESGSGKSFIVNEIIAANHYRDQKNFRWLDSDSENGNKFNTSKLYGFETSSEGKVIEGFAKDEKTGKNKAVNMTFHHAETVQEMDAWLTLFLSSLKSNEYAVFAQDSLDALTDIGAEDDAQERVTKLVSGKEVANKGSYKLGKQKFLSEFFASQVGELEKKNCLLIMTSQYRDKIGSMVPGQKSVSGGRALKYYCHTILDLSVVGKIEVSGRWIGSVVKARTKNKARTERPGREVFYNVYFTRGIDNVGSNIDFLFDLRGNDGKLKSDEVFWGGVMPTLKSVTTWLEETGKLDTYKEFAYRFLGRRTVNLDAVYQWAKVGDKEQPPACPEEYDSHFGKAMTRDELRDLCGSNAEARKKLRELVIEKWESMEAEASAAVGFQKTFDNFD